MLCALVACCSLVAVAVASTRVPNVRGTVTAAPATACPTGEPCDPRPPPLFVVFSRGRVTIRARIVAGGRFSLHLPPGRYVVGLAPPARRVVPGTITVPAVGVVRPHLVEQ